MTFNTSDTVVLPNFLGPVNGIVNLPGAKSLTHRAFIASSLSSGRSIIRRALICDDTRVSLNALKEFGAKFITKGEDLEISGFGGSPRLPNAPIFLQQSGTSLRLLVSLASLAPGLVCFTGDPRLFERPLEPLVAALKSLGGSIVSHPESGQIEVCGGKLKGGKIAISGGISSQFVSSLLMIAPILEKGLDLEIIPPIVSRPYINLTLDVLGKFGIEFDKRESGYSIPGKQRYKACHLCIEADLSTASYFWAFAAVTGGKVTTTSVPITTFQGEREFLKLLEGMGSSVRCDGSSVTVSGGNLHGINVDMRDIPDQVPTLAALGALAEGNTEISGVAHLRLKECDRLECLKFELEKLGANVTIETDKLRIKPMKKPLPGVELDSHNDHRLAMSFALLGLRIPNLLLKNPGCVSKSFPKFWETWLALLGPGFCNQPRINTNKTWVTKIS